MRYVLVLGALVACDEPALPAPPLPTPKLEPHDVAVIVAKELFTTLTPSQLRTGVHLDELVDTHVYTMWSSITTDGPHIEAITWLDPVTNAPGQIPYAYLDGDRPSLALVDLDTVDPARADLRSIGIDEIRIEIAKRPRTPEEALAAGCLPEPDDSGPQLDMPHHWRGPSYQFNTGTHWDNEVWIDLSPGPAGTRIGHGKMRADYGGLCIYDFTRRADRNHRRAIFGNVRSGAFCAEAIVELACDGTRLEMWAYYANGRYVEHGHLDAVK